MIFSIKCKFSGKTTTYDIDNNFCRVNHLNPNCELIGETGKAYGYLNTAGQRVWVPKSRCKKVEVV